MTVQYYKYRLPFAVPFQTSTNLFEEREGIVIELSTDNYLCYGEIAPLPGYSSETLGEVREILANYKNLLENSLGGQNPVDLLQNLYESEDIPASLQFGLDSIAYQIQAYRSGKNLHEYLFPDSSKQIPLNALVSLQSDDYISTLQQQLSEGFQTIKFKVGIDFEQELNRLHEIRTRYPDLTIRLDANQAWSTDEAITKCRQLQSLDVEYCEEPLDTPSPQNFETLSDQTEVPLAIDESLYQVSYWPNLLPYTSHLIIKPMLLGSFTKIFETKRFGDTHDNKAVFTSSLESGIGRTITAILAAGKGSPLTAQGLTTGKFLAQDVQSDINYISKGYYNLDKLPDRPEPATEQLQKVSSKLF